MIVKMHAQRQTFTTTWYQFSQSHGHRQSTSFCTLFLTWWHIHISEVILVERRKCFQISPTYCLHFEKEKVRMGYIPTVWLAIYIYIYIYCDLFRLSLTTTCCDHFDFRLLSFEIWVSSTQTLNHCNISNSLWAFSNDYSYINVGTIRT